MKKIYSATLIGCMLLTSPVYAKKLVLWNKLGSEEEVRHSEVGPNGEIVGEVLFELGQHGNGFRSAQRTGDPNIPDNFIRFPLSGLGPQGTIEIWYHPDWNDWRVGYVVSLFEYGIKNNLVVSASFNDWQNRGAAGVRDNDPNHGAGEYIYPSSDPRWHTERPMHFAVTWDASADKKVTVYLDGEAAGSNYSHSGTPVFLWSFDETPYLYVGSRMTAGDWYRHNWEPNIDGVIDNIKVWDYAKTDFSDRFDEATGASLKAEVAIAPNTLNRKSRGKWIAAYIELPDGYDAADISADTVRLDGTIPAESHPTEIGDYDNDGISDLMVKFDRQTLINRLNGARKTKEKISLPVSGTLSDGTPFEGTGNVVVL